MNKTNSNVDKYLSKDIKWKKEIVKLRSIIQDPLLCEEVKWGKLCYTFNDKNIAIIQGFKEFCAVLFFKGALLKDPKGILVKTGKNTQAGRQIRFTNIQDIVDLEPVLKAYIQEAIKVEKAGLEVKFKKTSEFEVAEEFQIKLYENPALQAAFDNLTPGRQRGYLLYFSGAKQSKTRASRVEKCMPKILKGKGLNDQ